ncbi:hypothetical protein [Haloarcula halophila]|uniref:hypothetical protein n=1 Tax=Haloarcula TaxID=2237 RepID=UPI0023E37BCE|nr:hypothetical protein [Halomicroarcula sp. DFY41]
MTAFLNGEVPERGLPDPVRYHQIDIGIARLPEVSGNDAVRLVHAWVVLIVFVFAHYDLFRRFDAMVEQVSPEALEPTGFARRRDPGGEIEF